MNTRLDLGWFVYVKFCVDAKETLIFKKITDAKLINGPNVTLLMLYDRHGTGCTPTELHEKSGIQPNLISRNVSVLLDDGAAMKRFPVRDSRSYVLYLTDLGIKKAHELLRTLEELVNIKM